MTNAEKTRLEQNNKKEMARTEPFEILTDVGNEFKAQDVFGVPIKNEKVVHEICRLLITQKLNYLEMNEALYQADKVLKYRALSYKKSNNF